MKPSAPLLACAAAMIATALVGAGCKSSSTAAPPTTFGVNITVNAKALSLVNKLHVKPEGNATSAGLQKNADATLRRLSGLKGAAYDRAYVENEVAYHKTVNGALQSTLIPSAKNGELKSLLESGLTLFREHQAHAEQVAKELK